MHNIFLLDTKLGFNLVLIEDYCILMAAFPLSLEGAFKMLTWITCYL